MSNEVGNLLLTRKPQLARLEASGGQMLRDPARGLPFLEGVCLGWRGVSYQERSVPLGLGQICGPCERLVLCPTKISGVFHTRMKSVPFFSP